MKKNLLSILILVLLVVNIILSVVMMVSVIGTNKKTGELITSIAAVLKLELYNPGGVAVTDVPMSDTEIYNIPSLMIPVFKADGKQGYVIFDLGLQQNMKHKDYKKQGGAEKMAAYESAVRDAANSVVSRHTQEDFQQDAESVRDELLKAIQELFSSDFIYRVSISNIKYS